MVASVYRVSTCWGWCGVTVIQQVLFKLDEQAYQLELLPPYMLASDAPNGDAQAMPWWWDMPSDVRGGLRRRSSRLVDGEETYEIAVVDRGQVVAYAGDRPVETAVNGVLRVGTHSQVGFGEFRVWPADRDRVERRAEAVSGGGA